MTSSIPNYKEILDAYGYAKHDRFISRMFIFQNDTKRSSTYHYKFDDLINELNTCDKKDLYISMNDFNAPSRKEENVHQLKHLYVDLDTYHSEYADSQYCNEQILEILNKDYFGKKFPIPNLTVSSGRGLYLIWNIQEHKNALPRWKTVQKYLCNLLQEFGADIKVATDSARVLRVPGSINTKSGKEVTILQKSSEKHTLYEFLDLYMPDSYMKGIRTREEIRKQSKETAKKNSFETKKAYSSEVTAKMECKIAGYHNNRTLLEARLQDLETLLLQERDKEHGSKEYIFFLYRMWALNLYKDTSIVNNLILSLNSRLKHASNPERLLEETKSAERYYLDQKVRNMKNETIIQFLSITPKEMKNCKTIISKEEAKLRKAIRNKQAYDAKLEEKNDVRKQEKILLRYERIINYLDSGLSLKEIAELLGQSYRQTLRDYKNIKADQTSQIPANTDHIKVSKEPEQKPSLSKNNTLKESKTQKQKPSSICYLDSYMTVYQPVTNIQPYLLQDVVLLDLPIKECYLLSYVINGWFLYD